MQRANPHLTTYNLHLAQSVKLSDNALMVNNFFSKLFSLLYSLLQQLGAGWRQLRCDFSNLRRRIFISQLSDYVVITLNGGLEEREPETPWYYSFWPNYHPPLTLEALDEMLHRIAGDPDLKGILFLCTTPELSLSQAQSLAALFGRFRTWDRQFNPIGAPKQLVFHLETVTSALFVAACAADKILVTPLTSWEVTGLRSEPLFLRETLAQVGISVDVVRVAPWKNAMDRFTADELSEEARAQYNWLLDSWYADIVQAIAQGRRLESDRVRQLIDGAPWTADKTLEAGLVDALLYEDQLPTYLGSNDKPATLKTYFQLRKLLYRHPRPGHDKSIGVISLQGSIMPGSSRNFPVPLPLFGEQTAGSVTVQQMIRAAREDESLAAVILHVDSPGGSALASDLMARELKLLADEKPLVIYMGNVAASGGYYVATPGHKIVAQRATLTGSIGVFSAKPITGPLYERLKAHRTSIQRGENAGLYSDASAWSASERKQVEASVQQIYHEFKLRVSEGRKLPFDKLDPICSGRVWTGTQAKTNGLVDELGDFALAFQLACELAKLPTDGRVDAIRITPPKQQLLSKPLGTTANESLNFLATLLFHDWERLFLGQSVWMLSDGLPKINQ
ncbi:MAG: S49 family peptidase [Caldilineaceae bacterium]